MAPVNMAEGFEVSIPKWNRVGIVSHVTYTIETKRGGKRVFTEKRYTDFEQLRSVLQASYGAEVICVWVWVCIPMLWF